MNYNSRYLELSSACMHISISFIFINVRFQYLLIVLFFLNIHRLVNFPHDVSIAMGGLSCYKRDSESQV